jgi:lipopolysaccharide transport system ATP-binding protein
MPDPIITVEGLGKRYRIRHEPGAPQYVALRDVIADKLASPFKRRKGPRRGAEDFWALRDVSFQVQPGEVLGIIGRNGAGKSTLLKVLSRITEPTEGRVTLGGRVASLLEVGTGFHPELDGRENIYLNGAILGMSRAEIARKFDEIVAFAEVEQFLDTPVKRYSSGMYMRLAFAVAAHLESEILVIDEVLAVGDAEFQKKCLGKMGEVSRSGRTVLFVSHNLNAVETLCTKAIALNKGGVSDHSDDVRGVITRYLGGASSAAMASEWINDRNACDHPAMQPLSFAVVNAQGQPLTTAVRNDQQLYVEIRADVRHADPALNAGFSLFNQESQELLWSLTTDGPEPSWPKLTRGINVLRCPLPRRFLNEGTYRLEMIASLHCRDWFLRPGHNSPAIFFEIQGGLSESPYWMWARPGILAPELAWERTE